MEPDRVLTDEEKRDLLGVVNGPRQVVMLMHGEGEGRQISFYAEGTRLEARISYPDAKADK